VPEAPCALVPDGVGPALGIAVLGGVGSAVLGCAGPAAVVLDGIGAGVAPAVLGPYGVGSTLGRRMPVPLDLCSHHSMVISHTPAGGPDQFVLVKNLISLSLMGFMDTPKPSSTWPASGGMGMPRSSLLFSMAKCTHHFSS
jgi:hypothetical protein